MEQEFLKIFNKVSSIISIICTFITNVLGTHWILFLGYLILNIFDYITGTIKSKIKKEESSIKGLIGIVKKICYWILIGVAFLISYLLVDIGSCININLEFVMLFGWFTLTCLFINEARSIIENLIEIGIKVPSFLKNGLEIYNKILENTIDKLLNNSAEQNNNNSSNKFDNK